MTRAEIQVDPLDEQNFVPCYEATDEENDEKIEIGSKHVDDRNDVAAHGAAIEEICKEQLPETGDQKIQPLFHFILVRLFQYKELCSVREDYR